MIVGNEGLAAVATPADRKAGLVCRPDNRQLLARGAAPNAESPAGIGRHHPNTLPRHAQELAEPRVQTPTALARRVKRDPVPVPVVDRHCGTRLHGARNDAVIHELEPHAARRRRKDTVDLRPWAAFPEDSKIASVLRPENRAVGLQSARGMSHDGQLVELYLDQICGLTSLV